jgi:hypothetical protein
MGDSFAHIRFSDLDEVCHFHPEIGKCVTGITIIDYHRRACRII